jgi:hypothetical protein
LKAWQFFVFYLLFPLKNATIPRWLISARKNPYPKQKEELMPNKGNLGKENLRNRIKKTWQILMSIRTEPWDTDLEFIWRFIVIFSTSLFLGGGKMSIGSDWKPFEVDTESLRDLRTAKPEKNPGAPLRGRTKWSMFWSMLLWKKCLILTPPRELSGSYKVVFQAQEERGLVCQKCRVVIPEGRLVRVLWPPYETIFFGIDEEGKIIPLRLQGTRSRDEVFYI